MTAAAQIKMLHDTITMERTYNASPARVFAAWESVEARLRWSVPFPEAGAAYDQAEFKVGGLDIMRAAPRMTCASSHASATWRSSPTSAS